MAFELNKPKVDKTVEAAQQRQTQLLTGAGSSGEGAQAATGIGPAQPQTAAPKFTNIQSILNANKNAGQELTGMVGSKIGSEIQQGSQAVGKASGDVSTVAGAIQKGKDALTNTLSSLNPPAAAAPTGGAPVAQATGTNTQGNTTQSTTEVVQNAPPAYTTGTFDPAHLATNQGDLDWLTGFTTGKTQTQQGTDLKAANQRLSDVGALTQKQAQDRLAALGNASGRQSMLEEMVAKGNPNYGRGVSSLDQAFMQLQGKPFFKQQQLNLQGQQQSLGNLITTGTKAGETAGTALGESQKLSTDVLGALGKGETSLIGEEDTRAKDVAAKNIKANQVLEDFRTGGYAAVKPEDSDLLNSLIGQSVQSGEHTYGLTNDDLVGYINKGAVDVGRKDVITPEELQKYQMLRRLQGRDIEGSDVAFTEAGKPIVNAGFASDKLRAELDKRQAEFDAAARDTTAYAGYRGWSDAIDPELIGATSIVPSGGIINASQEGISMIPKNVLALLGQNPNFDASHANFHDFITSGSMADIMAGKTPQVTGESISQANKIASSVIDAMNSPSFPKNQSGLVYGRDLAGLMQNNSLNLSAQDQQELQQGVTKDRASELINNAAKAQTGRATEYYKNQGNIKLKQQLDAFLKSRHYDTTFGGGVTRKPKANIPGVTS